MLWDLCRIGVWKGKKEVWLTFIAVGGANLKSVITLHEVDDAINLAGPKHETDP